MIKLSFAIQHRELCNVDIQPLKGIDFPEKLIFYKQCSKLKKKSKLCLFQKPGNQSREFGCPDESGLVAW